jgi:hypothetical protein
MVRYDYAKFEISDPLEILSLNTSGLWPRVADGVDRGSKRGDR